MTKEKLKSFTITCLFITVATLGVIIFLLVR